MKSNIEKTFTQVFAAIKESFQELSDSAKAKSNQVVDDWLAVFPELESMGLEISSFGIGLAISPRLEVELSGSGAAFTEERLNELIENYKDNTYVSLVLKTIRTTRKMYLKIGKDVYDDIFIQIRVQIPPEVRVYFGKPSIY